MDHRQLHRVIYVSVYLLLLIPEQFLSSLLSPHCEKPSHNWQVGIHSPFLTHRNVLRGHAVYGQHIYRSVAYNTKFKADKCKSMGEMGYIGPLF